MQAALAIRQAQLPAEHPHVGQSLYFLGQHYFQAGDLEQAQTYLEKAVAIGAKKRPNDTETADAYIYLANCHLQNGAMDATRTCLEKAREIQEGNLVPDHFYTVNRLLGSGDLALVEGDRALARQLFEQAASIFGQTAAASHPDWLRIQERLAAALPEAGSA